MDFPFKIFSLTENALTIQFPPQISWELIQYMHAFKSRVTKTKLEGILNIEVSFYEITMFYDPSKIDRGELIPFLKKTLRSDPALENPLSSSATHHIPVCYDLEMALDLSKMESQTGIDFEKIVDLHTESELRVFMLGFLPGFVYLGGMNDKIRSEEHTSELQSRGHLVCRLLLEKKKK